MTTNIEYDTLLKARDAANLLREQLLKRLAGIRVNAMKCGCGAVHCGEAEVVDIAFSDIDDVYADQIGLFLSCSCSMREIGNPHNRDFDYSMGLSHFISHAELHLMFRQAFEPVGVPIEHLFAEPFSSGPKFVGSGQTATVEVGKPVYIRPIGDASQVLWRNAQVRIDCNVERYEAGSYIACKIDPFASPFARGNYHYAKVQAPCFFAARLFDVNVLLPIVKVLEVSEDGTSATVETNDGIEFYQPEV